MNSMISQWTRSYEQSHASVARILAQEAGITVVVEGDGFANSSDFQILGIVRKVVSASNPVLSMEALKKAAEEQSHTHKTQKNRAGKSLQTSTIYMPALPPDSPPMLHKALDGGLLHEIFHSLYTTRGTPDLLNIYHSLRTVWDDTKIKKIAALLPAFWNVFEDIMIERKGCDTFPGSPPLLQAVHEYLWEREANIQLEPFTRPWYIAYSICYLRDYGKSLIYLQNIPLYEDDVQDIYTQEIFDLAMAAESTSDTLVVAIKALYLLWDFLSEQEPEKEDEDEGEDGDDDEKAQPGNEGSGGSGEDEKAGEKGDPSEKGSPGLPLGDSDSTQEDEQGEDSSDEPSGKGDQKGKGESPGDDPGEGDDSESENEGENSDGDDEDGEGADTGEQSDQDGEGAGNRAGQGGDLAPLTMEDLEGIEDNLSKILEDVLKSAWEHSFQEGRKTDRIIRPHYIKDLFVEAPASGTDAQIAKMNAQVRPLLARMKPPIIALLQNKDKMVRKSYQDTGRSLSTRSLNTILALKPRPFEQRYQEHAEKSCVLILIDLSGSMQVAMETAAAALLAVSQVLHSLCVPFGIIGFTSRSEVTDDMRIYTHTDRLMLFVAKDFNEKFSKDIQSRIAGLRAQYATPLPDVFDLGIHLLKNRTEKNKHLWIISDGAPYYASKCEVDTLSLLKKRMEAAALTTKPFLLNVDMLGNSTHTQHLTNTQTIRSFEDVPTALMNHLKKV